MPCCRALGCVVIGVPSCRAGISIGVVAVGVAVAATVVVFALSLATDAAEHGTMESDSAGDIIPVDTEGQSTALRESERGAIGVDCTVDAGPGCGCGASSARRGDVGGGRIFNGGSGGGTAVGGAIAVAGGRTTSQTCQNANWAVG